MANQFALPNFGSFFAVKDRQPIEFVCRVGANFFHDLIFLSSFLHDAEFNPKSIALHKKRLYIPMQRDRWELWDGKGDLEQIDTELSIEPVISISWQLKNRRMQETRVAKLTSVWLRSTYAAESFWEREEGGELVLADHGDVKLRIEIDGLPLIRMKDRLLNGS